MQKQLAQQQQQQQQQQRKLTPPDLESYKTKCEKHERFALL